MKYQFLPPLSDYEYEALKADIAERGIMVPIEYDQDGNVLDGHHRLRICDELGIAEWPRIVRAFASEQDRRTHARQLNLSRRHLTQQQRRVLIEDELRERPERSNRQIAAALGVDDTTVGDARRRLESTAGIPQLERTVGGDGKWRRPKLAALDFGTEGHGVTVAAASKIRAEKAEHRYAARMDRLREISIGNTSLPGEKRYPVIYADPPWHFEVYNEDSGVERAAANHYPTMKLDEICGLPISELAMTDAILFMWTTAPHLEESFRVLAAWGFEYKTNAVWVKHAQGLGFFVRGQHELLLIATCGDMPCPLPASRPPSVIQAPRREHSQKPDEAYDLIERMYPELPKIELFARNIRPGWSAWGNEIAEAAE